MLTERMTGWGEMTVVGTRTRTEDIVQGGEKGRNLRMGKNDEKGTEKK